MIGRRRGIRLIPLLLLLATAAGAWDPKAVKDDPLVRMPGTQPEQMVSIESPGRCLNCHAPGATDNAARIATPRSHPAWGDCRQCHVERQTTAVQVSNRFEPLRYPARGHRQTEIAPPMIPHTPQNRESCSTCHIGEQAPAALRAAHGHRANCQQCHVATVD